METISEIPALPVLGPLTVASMIASGIFLWRRGSLTVPRLLAAWVFCCYVAAVAAVTILPLQLELGVYANRAPWYEKANFIPVLTIDVTTFVLNVIMMVPLGVLLALTTRVRGTGRVALIALAFSGIIEAIQFVSNVVVSSGRTGDVNDLIANVLGAVGGYLLIQAFRKNPRFAALTAPFRLHPAVLRS
jgi:glycopeptide antibiotics resistance protein